MSKYPPGGTGEAHRGACNCKGLAVEGKGEQEISQTVSWAKYTPQRQEGACCAIHFTPFAGSRAHLDLHFYLC